MGIEPTTNTSELILYFTICVRSATRHNIHYRITKDGVESKIVTQNERIST